MATENSNIEICIPSTIDENIGFFVTRKTHKEDDEKSGWVNTDGGETNSIFDMIADIFGRKFGEDLLLVYCF